MRVRWGLAWGLCLGATAWGMADRAGLVPRFQGKELFSLDAGEARFFLRTSLGEGSCRARGPGGSFEGELCPTGIRGWKEFRGRVPRGRFVLSPGGKKRAEPRKTEGPGKGWAYAEGRLVPRFRLQGGEGAWRWRGDLYRWRKDAWELCLEVHRREEGPEAGGAKVGEELLRIPLARGLQVSRIHPAGELRWRREGDFLVLDPGPAGLRPGDRSWVCLGLGMGGSLPARRMLPMGALAFATPPLPRRGSPVGAGDGGLDLGALSLLVDRLVAGTPREPPVRGDFPRVYPGGKSLWTHGEFDLPLGLGRAAGLLKRRDALELAQLAARHVFGRDLGEGPEGRSLLPAMHSGLHGGDRVEPGHVFLQGALVLALCAADRAFLAFLHRVGEALRSRVLSLEWRPKALRDLAWPLLAFETADLLWRAEGTFGEAAERVLRALERNWDLRRGGFLLPETWNEEERRAVRPLWIEGGLLVPGLLLGKARGRRRARELLRRVKRDFRRLGLGRNPCARAQAVGSGAWRGMGGAGAGGRDPLGEAWTLEGVWGLEAREGRWTPRRARACLRRVLQLFGKGPKAGGLRWDPATRLAIALQASWIRESLRRGLSGSPGLRRGSPFRPGR